MPVPLNPQSTNIQPDPAAPNHAAKQPPHEHNANHGVKSKKESHRPPPPPPTINSKSRQKTQQGQPLAPQSNMKKLTRKSSKPIINWFQRKLAGTVRARRASDGDALRAQRLSGTRSPSRRTSVPVPPVPIIPPRQRSNKSTRPQQKAASTIASTKHNTVSLNEEDDFSSITDGRTIDSIDGLRTSSALESTWSPNSAYEADEDASVRPLPPSAPPSPSPSRSSSSYLSDPRTFASMAASTKPTTLLSVDITGGMAHIAQAPPTPTTPHRITAYVRTHSTGPSSGGSITFSALPPTTPSRHSSTGHAHTSSISSRGPHGPSLQAPQHTAHHPRNNPRPSSPPMDNASVLTLASSAFAMPGTRTGVGALAFSGRASTADDSLSHFSHPTGLGDSTSHFLLGDLDGEGDDDRLLMEGDRDPYGDVDASVRALRPRSSRRGSWESEASRWSARIANGGGVRERSLWTNGSYRTGARSLYAENEYEEDKLDEDNKKREHGDGTSGPDGDSLSLPADASTTDQVVILPDAASLKTGEDASVASPTNTESTEAAPGQPPSAHLHHSGSITPKEKALETPKGTALPLEELPALPPSPSPHTEEKEGHERRESHDGSQSLAPTDVFVSAPSTPMG